MTPKARAQDALDALNFITDMSKSEGTFMQFVADHEVYIREALALSAVIEKVPDDQMLILSGKWADGLYNCRIENRTGHKFKVPEGAGKTLTAAILAAVEKMEKKI